MGHPHVLPERTHFLSFIQLKITTLTEILKTFWEMYFTDTSTRK